MEYISVKEAARRWGIHVRVVQQYCAAGRVPGAQKYERSWMLPADSRKPEDPRRTSAQRGPADPRYLDCGLLMTVHPIAPPVADSFDNDVLRRQYECELAYLRGDFEQAKASYYATQEDDPLRICACSVAMLAAVSSGDYAGYIGMEAFLKRLEAGECGAQAVLPAQSALALVSESMIAPQMAPAWVRCGALSALPPSARLMGSYLYIRHLCNIKAPEAALSAARVTLALAEYGSGFTSMDVYLRLLCAVVCTALEDRQTARHYLDEALAIGLPLGYITPFAELLTALSGLLEQSLQRDWPNYYDVILDQWNQTFKNWIAFHNQFTKDNISVLLSLREYQLAQLLANGATYVQAAQRLNLSVGRVKDLVNVIYGKLFIGSKQELKQYIL